VRRIWRLRTPRYDSTLRPPRVDLGTPPPDYASILGPRRRELLDPPAPRAEPVICGDVSLHEPLDTSSNNLQLIGQTDQPNAESTEEAGRLFVQFVEHCRTEAVQREGALDQGLPSQDDSRTEVGPSSSSPTTVGIAPVSAEQIPRGATTLRERNLFRLATAGQILLDQSLLRSEQTEVSRGSGSERAAVSNVSKVVESDYAENTETRHARFLEMWSKNRKKIVAIRSTIIANDTAASCSKGSTAVNQGSSSSEASTAANQGVSSGEGRGAVSTEASVTTSVTSFTSSLRDILRRSIAQVDPDETTDPPESKRMKLGASSATSSATTLELERDQQSKSSNDVGRTMAEGDVVGPFIPEEDFQRVAENGVDTMDTEGDNVDVTAADTSIEWLSVSAESVEDGHVAIVVNDNVGLEGDGVSSEWVPESEGSAEEDSRRAAGSRWAEIFLDTTTESTIEMPPSVDDRYETVEEESGTSSTNRDAPSVSENVDSLDVLDTSDVVVDNHNVEFIPSYIQDTATTNTDTNSLSSTSLPSLHPHPVQALESGITHSDDAAFHFDYSNQPDDFLLSFGDQRETGVVSNNPLRVSFDEMSFGSDRVAYSDPDTLTISQEHASFTSQDPNLPNEHISPSSYLNDLNCSSSADNVVTTTFEDRAPVSSDDSTPMPVVFQCVSTSDGASQGATLETAQNYFNNVDYDNDDDNDDDDNVRPSHLWFNKSQFGLKKPGTSSNDRCASIDDNATVNGFQEPVASTSWFVDSTSQQGLNTVEEIVDSQSSINPQGASNSADSQVPMNTAGQESVWGLFDSNHTSLSATLPLDHSSYASLPPARVANQPLTLAERLKASWATQSNVSATSRHGDSHPSTSATSSSMYNATEPRRQADESTSRGMVGSSGMSARWSPSLAKSLQRKRVHDMMHSRSVLSPPPPPSVQPPALPDSPPPTHSTDVPSRRVAEFTPSCPVDAARALSAAALARSAERARMFSDLRESVSSRYGGAAGGRGGYLPLSEREGLHAIVRELRSSRTAPPPPPPHDCAPSCEVCSGQAPILRSNGDPSLNEIPLETHSNEIARLRRQRVAEFSRVSGRDGNFDGFPSIEERISRVTRDLSLRSVADHDNVRVTSMLAASLAEWNIEAPPSTSSDSAAAAANVPSDEAEEHSYPRRLTRRPPVGETSGAAATSEGYSRAVHTVLNDERIDRLSRISTLSNLGR